MAVIPAERTAIRNFLGITDITVITDDILDERIEEADNRLTDDEIATTNADYIRLRKHAVGAALVRDFASGALSGLGAEGSKLKSEQVGDVKASYGGEGDSAAGGNIIKDLPGGGYENEYLRILEKNYANDMDYMIQDGSF